MFCSLRGDSDARLLITTSGGGAMFPPGSLSPDDGLPLTDFLFETVTYPACGLALFTFAQLSLFLFRLPSATLHLPSFRLQHNPGGVGEGNLD